jgi:hypothetical protein
MTQNTKPERKIKRAMRKAQIAMMIRTRTVNTPAPVYGTHMRSLYLTLGNSPCLHENSTYTVYLNIESLNHQYSFTTEYEPAFCSAREVRIDIGNTLDRYPDADIWHIIRDNTLYLQAHISDNYAPDDESLDIINGSDYSMRRWVRIKTQIDCIYGAYAMIAMHLDSERHMLGFLDISHSPKLPYIDDLLKKLKDELRELEVLLFGFHPQSAVKGGRSYPYNPNRNSF